MLLPQQWAAPRASSPTPKLVPRSNSTKARVGGASLTGRVIAPSQRDALGQQHTRRGAACGEVLKPSRQALARKDNAADNGPRADHA
ncbi:MAG: hypothetical protein SGJ11_05305 [Phycisphaerae bacterium]|nr:hypothetical protein [Phycisphaerae bacterium]